MINHVTVTVKSSENDHSLSTFFSTRTNMDHIYQGMTGNLDGVWSKQALSSTSLYKRLLPDSPPAVGSIRRHHPETKARESGSEAITIDGRKFRRYCFIHKLEFPLAERENPLPKDCTIKLVFYRAPVSKSLLSVKLDANDLDTGGLPPNYILPLINPVLQIKYVQSDKFDKKYASHRISNVKFPFLSKTIRREVLQTGIANFKIPIAQGRLPIAICFALTEPDLFDGSLVESLTHFKPYGLDMFDLSINSRSISGYPLKTNGTNHSNFYFHFLEQCNLWKNTISPPPLSYDEFMKTNYMIVDNLQRRGLQDGQLTLSLQFKNVLDKNYLLIIQPIYQQLIEFDSYLNATMRSSSSSEAEKANKKLDD